VLIFPTTNWTLHHWLGFMIDLLISWYTIELIIADNTILDNATSTDLFASLENTFICTCNKTNLQNVSIGSFLFVDEQNIPLSTTSTLYDSLYLLNCTCSSDEDNVSNLFCIHKSTNIHVLDTHLNSLYLMRHWVICYQLVIKLLHCLYMTPSCLMKLLMSLVSSYYLTAQPV